MPVLSSLLLIAGGSGSGKSTLAAGLAARYPDWAILHLDDYQKPKSQVPKVNGRRNWDEPSVVDFTKLVEDVHALRRGQAVEVEGWSRTANRNDFLRERFTVKPGPVLVVEGYFALWFPELRELADFKVYLDAPPEVRHARRLWDKSDDYIEQILEPMHQRYIQPTAAYADLIVFAGESSPEAIVEMILTCTLPCL